jgi:hypothetical protein
MYYDDPEKQVDKNACGFYAFAQAMEAKAKMRGQIKMDDSIDPILIQTIYQEKYPKQPLLFPEYLIDKIIASICSLDSTVIELNNF